MGIMVYSLLWVVQDFVHQPWFMIPSLKSRFLHLSHSALQVFRVMVKDIGNHLCSSRRMRFSPSEVHGGAKYLVTPTALVSFNRKRFFVQDTSWLELMCFFMQSTNCGVPVLVEGK